MSFIIDGHHKTCAASVLRRPVNCIAIIPVSAYEYKKNGDEMLIDSLCFSNIRINSNDIPAQYLTQKPNKELFVNKNKVELSEGKFRDTAWG